MGRIIVKIKDKYLEWSTICDAPTTKGMTLEQLHNYIKDQYGRIGLEELPARLERVEATGTSAYGEDLAGTISFNRAGPNEEQLTEDEIYHAYCQEEPLESTELPEGYWMRESDGGARWWETQTAYSDEFRDHVEVTLDAWKHHERARNEVANRELARRAVACKGWRWMEGALYWSGGIDYRIAYLCKNSGTWVAFERTTDGKRQYGISLDHALPDLNDPATLGCLLALVREAYDHPCAHAEAHEFEDPEKNFWLIWAGAESFEADTEVEALVKALESAP
jgi:hypothetical protein